jgi:hypothetical protein
MTAISTSSRLLAARADLADAIVVAARANVVDARRRGDRSLLAGCEAALTQRIAEARALRTELGAAR